jgi:hypothetical protein
MKKQKVDKYAETEVLKGTSHQEIFDHIISTSEFNIHDVADIVRKIPTLEKRKKYKTLNNILLLIIGLTIVDRIILMYIQISNGQNDIGIAFLFPVLSIVLFYVIYKYKRNAHLSAGFLFIYGSMASIIRIITQQDIFFYNQCCNCFFRSIYCILFKCQISK